ncbi:MAG: hypothetical protein IM638_05325 [Bacteroidetes bacterium]|nr:hypothetical protein [Bacteroidota bacterium]
MKPREVYRFYKKLIVASTAGKFASEEALAGWCLVNKPTFRMQGFRANDPLAGLRVWKQLVTSLSQNTEAAKKMNDANNSVAVFDNKASEFALRIMHVRQNTGEMPGLYISRQELLGTDYPGRSKTFGLVQALLLAFNRGKRLPKALLLREAHEAAALLHILHSKSIKQLHFYSPYEKDANALTLLLRAQGIAVNKIPSPSLLAAHHNELIADQLSLGSPYQADELYVSATRKFVKQLQHWTPEIWPRYGAYYELKLKSAAPQNTLGFYSHAVWLRETENNIDTGFGDHQAEKQLLPLLAQWCRTHKQVLLIIFLHPRERKPEYIAQTEAFYARMFEGVNYRFSEAGIPSTQQFAKADTGIGAMSTILFERLFAGYKTLFFPAGINNFPLPGSALANVCAVTQPQLDALLDKAMSETTDAFLASFQLEKYTAAQWLGTDTQKTVS